MRMKSYLADVRSRECSYDAAVMEKCVNIEREMRRAAAMCCSASNYNHSVSVKTEPHNGYLIMRMHFTSTIKIETS